MKPHGGRESVVTKKKTENDNYNYNHVFIIYCESPPPPPPPRCSVGFVLLDFSFMCICFVDRCLSFCPFSFGHCGVCSSLIYGFWLSLWYLQTLLERTWWILFMKRYMRHGWMGGCEGGREGGGGGGVRGCVRVFCLVFYFVFCF